MLEPDEIMGNISVGQGEVFPFGARVAYLTACNNYLNPLFAMSRPLFAMSRPLFAMSRPLFAMSRPLFAMSRKEAYVD